MTPIPFNRPFATGKEISNLAAAQASAHLSGDGPFTKACHAWLATNLQAGKALLTHSCTAALEMAALLAEVGEGDEVIMPSYTFVSTANAFVLRGAVPVFVDVRPDTLNLDEEKIEEAISPRTRAIVPVHYAGVACNMDAIMGIATQHEFLVIEDAAQAIMSEFRGRRLGSFGQLAALSFHETKNIIAGEGGALLINDPALVQRAEIIREKGTNRSQFFHGQVDKYTWVDIGSSYLPGELTAAYLAAQLEEAAAITNRRVQLWHRYHAAFESLERNGLARCPVVPEGCVSNGHIYYLLLQDESTRARFIAHMARHGIHCPFHYVPLHSSPYGRTHGRASGALQVTGDIADRLVRLPLWIGLENRIDSVIGTVLAFFGSDT